LALSIPFIIFIAASSPHLDVANGLCGPHKNTLRAGQCYWYTHPILKRYNLSLSIHLAAILPAGLLAILQFIPKLRQRCPAFHRWAGRLSLCLSIPGILSVPFLLDRSFGGGLDTRSSATLLCGITLWAVIKAWTSARARKFEEHRRWATRAWMWLGCIVTHRAVMGMFAMYVSLAGPKLAASIPCPEVWNMVDNGYETGLDQYIAWSDYPTCSGMAANGMMEERYGLVYGDFLSSKPEEKVAALHLAFGPAFWVAILIHVAATEIYLGRKGGKGLRSIRLDDAMERTAQLVNGKGAKES
ncbi:MAG: hypothetical protein LQ338_006853, partial [Usnochroma carphineum]